MNLKGQESISQSIKQRNITKAPSAITVMRTMATITGSRNITGTKSMATAMISRMIVNGSIDDSLERLWVYNEYITGGRECQTENKGAEFPLPLGTD